MRYYVTSDPHGFYTILRDELEAKGFFTDTEPHKLIICGDLMDRGNEAAQMEKFIMELLEKDQVVLVRGNHEDLYEALLLKDRGFPRSHHIHNGTYNTVEQLTGLDMRGHNAPPRGLFVEEGKKTDFYSHIIPAMYDYYETKHYVFVHGWIPYKVNFKTNEFIYDKNWRRAARGEVAHSRWVNGMDLYKWIKVPKKTVVCGHWHASYGHCNIEHKCSEFGEDADFSPFYGDGIIALDACTAYSHKVNVIVIEDDPRSKVAAEKEKEQYNTCHVMVIDGSSKGTVAAEGSALPGAGRQNNRPAETGQVTDLGGVRLQR